MLQQRVAGDPLPAEHVRLLKVLRVRANREWSGIVLSEQITGRTTHWIDGRTRKCIGPDLGCQHCSRQAPRKWRGYVHVMLNSAIGSAILELTPDLARSILQAWPSRDSLRGIQIQIRRGASNNSRIVLESTNDQLSSLVHLPAEVDPGQTIDFLLES